MADLSVERWRQQGNVAMWQIRDDRDPRWNLSADESGCKSLENLFGLMQVAKWPSKVTVELTQPTVTANGAGVDLRFAESVVLKFPVDRVPDDHWQIAGNDQPAISFGRQRLAEFKSAMVDICSGNGDYAIGTETDGLWLWWWVAGT